MSNIPTPAELIAEARDTAAYLSWQHPSIIEDRVGTLMVALAHHLEEALDRLEQDEIAFNASAQAIPAMVEELRILREKVGE
jgi:hypothetical protein